MALSLLNPEVSVSRPVFIWLSLDECESETMWISIVSIEDFITNSLSFTLTLMKFQQHNRMVMCVNQGHNKNIISFPSTFFLEINNLTIAGDTSIQYHKTKKCPKEYNSWLQKQKLRPIMRLLWIRKSVPLNNLYMFGLLSKAHFTTLSYIKHKDFLCLFVPPPSVTLVLPPLKSETVWTGEFWSNRVLQNIVILIGKHLAFSMFSKTIHYTI